MIQAALLMIAAFALGTVFGLFWGAVLAAGHENKLEAQREYRKIREEHESDHENACNSNDDNERTGWNDIRRGSHVREQ